VLRLRAPALVQAFAARGWPLPAASTASTARRWPSVNSAGSRVTGLTSVLHQLDEASPEVLPPGFDTAEPIAAAAGAGGGKAAHEPARRTAALDGRRPAAAGQPGAGAGGGGHRRRGRRAGPAAGDHAAGQGRLRQCKAGISYTLYYATTFVFTGLAVAVAFHGGLFNIGGEGQACWAGWAARWWRCMPGPAPGRGAAAAADGAGGDGLRRRLGGGAGALQAWRGSHVVITTIMFNFIASALLAYLLVNVLKDPGSMSVETAPFPNRPTCPACTRCWGAGHRLAAHAAEPEPAAGRRGGGGVYLFLWRSRAGYELRAVGFSPDAAHYGGIRPRGQVMLAMGMSGALAGLVGINELAGVQHRLLLDFVVGAGFTGIAVSLIGRNHPVGIVLAALLFGALFQGGAELAFEIPGFSRDMVTTLQGLIVLFSGAMAQVAAPALARLHRLARRPTEVAHG
jgi:general nucleoside transport system permease protein